MQLTTEKVYALVTTKNRPLLLKERSLKSIIKQTYSVNKIVLIDDSDNSKSQEENRFIIESLKTSIPVVYLKNKRTPGAAGAWNTGIDYIYQNNNKAWIAILDDDDEWRTNHIETCLKYANENSAVISGIKTILNGCEINNKKIKEKFIVSDFFAGNPGWQGSNTFITASFLKSIGGFDESLLCTHDRDLAIRCLNRSDFTCSHTNEYTVNYYLDNKRKSLTSTQSTKTTGLLQFWKKHQNKMTQNDKLNYINRAKEYFDVNPVLFDILDKIDNEYPGFNNDPNKVYNFITNKITFIWYYIIKFLLNLRTLSFITALKGYAYQKSTEKIEIDITYDCTLKCKNCNRSCRQAPEQLHMSVKQIQKFVNDSIGKGIEWKRIRILGGEPTLHPKFIKILTILVNYKMEYPRSRIEIVTNGYSRKTKRLITHIPPLIHVENSKKISELQTYFDLFNKAPQDSFFYKLTNFKNGCSNLEDCGLGLTPSGYYPCAIAGGIDRIAKWNIGRNEIPLEEDDMTDILEKACKLCGRFRSRRFIPYKFRIRNGKEVISKSWRNLYSKWDGEKHD